MGTKGCAAHPREAERAAVLATMMEAREAAMLEARQEALPGTKLLDAMQTRWAYRFVRGWTIVHELHADGTAILHMVAGGGKSVDLIEQLLAGVDARQVASAAKAIAASMRFEECIRAAFPLHEWSRVAVHDVVNRDLLARSIHARADRFR